MRFEWFVALRYLRDAKGQSSLILAAVSVGVAVIVFLSALINGLQSSLIDKTLGSQAHVTLRVPREVPRALVEPTDTLAISRLVQPAHERLRSIDQWPEVMVDVGRLPGVTAVSPLVIGAGTAIRADAKRPIVIRGVDPDLFTAIIDVRKRIVSGRYDLAGSAVAIGSTLASDLGVGVGDKLRLQTPEGVEDVVQVSAIFSLGNMSVDKMWVLTSLRHAQSLFALSGGVTAIEVKVADVFAAEQTAEAARGLTGLAAESWMTVNAELLVGLSAQNSSKSMIQFFVVVAVALGIASVLIVAVVQKSKEIGILRAFGTPARRILWIFLAQGGLLGLIGSFFGSGLGTLLARIFESVARGPDGAPKFPVQLDATLYISASLLATGVGLAAAALPALRASKLDPATAIGNG